MSTVVHVWCAAPPPAEHLIIHEEPGHSVPLFPFQMELDTSVTCPRFEFGSECF